MTQSAFCSLPVLLSGAPTKNSKGPNLPCPALPSHWPAASGQGGPRGLNSLLAWPGVQTWGPMQRGSDGTQAPAPSPASPDALSLTLCSRPSANGRGFSWRRLWDQP